MALKKVSSKVEILSIDGSEIHAVKPTKGAWDEYVDAVFIRDEDGNVQTKNSQGIRALYRLCIKKLVNVDYEKDGQMVTGATLTNPDEIVDFLTGITDVTVGRQVDTWLLDLADLTKEESKN